MQSFYVVYHSLYFISIAYPIQKLHVSNRKIQDNFFIDLVTTGLGQIVDIRSIPYDPIFRIADKVGIIRELTFDNEGAVESNTIFLDIEN